MGQATRPDHTAGVFLERVMKVSNPVPGLLCVAVSWLGVAEFAAAQDATEPVKAEAEASSRPRDFSFLIMPIPISDPAVGNGLAIGAGALYRVGGSDRPWLTGGGVFYTDNQSKGAAVAQKAYLGGDRFRVLAGAGLASINVDFYGIGPEAGNRGVSVPISQDATFVGGQALMRAAPHLYVGLQYRFIDLTTTLNATDLPFPDLNIPAAELDAVSSALGLGIEYDTRDKEYGPSSGLYITGAWLVADEAWGSDRDYARAELRVNGYSRASENAVWAWRVSGCWAGDSAPFYDICNYGSQSDLRGYVSGQYRDRSMVAAQAEYRRHLFGRFGMVLFAGIGGVGSEFDDIVDELLPAAGVGLRYEASRKYGVNVGVDYAVGKDSSAVYFRIGEAF